MTDGLYVARDTQGSSTIRQAKITGRTMERFCVREDG
jgi:hypothetical protein